uniref:Uncharacterized protein n=1 Tax=Physcomitrium patens TaxID=3218 RepID=A0A7I4EEA5_PHYPA
MQHTLPGEILNKPVDAELVLATENSHVHKPINRTIVNCHEGIVVIITNLGDTIGMLLVKFMLYRDH